MTAPAAATAAIAQIKREHRALACVLGAMQALVARYREPGVRPDVALFGDMIEYVENVPDRVHHPREDSALFPAVAAASAEGARLVRELERDHAGGGPMLAALRAAWQSVADGRPNSLNQLSTAVDDFAEFYWSHMRKEEQQLLPQALERLSAQEWANVNSAFSDNRDPLFDAALTDRYRELYRRIAELAPGSVKSLLEGAETP